MSSNSSWSEANPDPNPLLASAQSASQANSGENPPWTGRDVFYIVMVMFASLVICLIGTTLFVKRVAYPNATFMQVMGFPLVAFAAQMCSYLVTLGFMFTTATQTREHSFRQAVRWNWPGTWPAYVVLGVVFAVALQLLARFLPMPKEIPMEAFFKTALRAWILSIAAMTLVPLMEELFFRGFLYPVVARRLGVIFAVLFTTVSFTAIHVPQLADPHMPLSASWGAILLILIIGLALTIVRAVKKSVAAGVVMHMAYNGFTSVAAIVVTGGFRHLDRLSH
jgi:membrane protease YdiL (CAAX protease family)